ncbi:MAG: hypothetical protein RMK18_03885 [Armatimonadota bacterium]|nr:hypothetical protein [Armatimonadota bacterium]MCX7777163.1 hypothetical protein [Armatimonadota bacterium]MDW8024990.1 hypothetical protein [Armatimonadota bacterium]
MGELLEHLRDTLAKIRSQLDEIDRLREKCFELSRRLIRQCSAAIKHVHRNERNEAEVALGAAGEIAEELYGIASTHPEILSWGFVQDAQREFAEAMLIFTVAFGGVLPTPEDLKVTDVAYINGLAEAVSELRRLILSKLNGGDFESARKLMEIMENIYYELLPFDHPDAITLGLRRRVDQLRLLLERTAGDLTLASQCTTLVQLLKRSAEGEKR